MRDNGVRCGGERQLLRLQLRGGREIPRWRFCGLPTATPFDGRRGWLLYRGKSEAECSALAQRHVAAVANLTAAQMDGSAPFKIFNCRPFRPTRRMRGKG